MIRRPPRSTRTDPLFPYTTLFRSARAEAMAGQAYRPPYRPAPELVRQIDYEAHGKIRFDPERALYGPGSGGTLSAYPATFRSEEHTSELQSLMRISYAVFCLKKKKNKNNDNSTIY